MKIFDLLSWIPVIFLLSLAIIFFYLSVRSIPRPLVKAWQRVIKILKFIKDIALATLFPFLFIASFFSLPILIPRVIDGFTSVETLTKRCMEAHSSTVRVGAICSDGWRSHATGRGACSWHGGVSEWIYTTRYHKSYYECKEDAKRQSWIAN